jgi:hypothetical protein
VRKLIIFLVSLILVTGCCTQRRCNQKFPPVQTVNDSSAVTTHESVQEKDSISYLPADSSWLKALLECNEHGQVIMKELQGYKDGKNVEVPWAEISNNVLTVKCNVDSVAVYNRISKRFKNKIEYKDREVLKEKRVNYLTPFQTAEIKGFYIASALLLILGSLFIYKITH